MIDHLERYHGGQPFWTAAKFMARAVKRAANDFMTAAKLHDDNPEDPTGRHEMALALTLAASRLAKLKAAAESWAGPLPALTIPSAPPDAQGGAKSLTPLRG